MIVCIAEKPSVGRDIAKVLGATSSHDGYMEGNGYQVTWTFGHLCALLDPQEYTEQWKNWTLSSLPMIPQRFGIKVTADAGVQKQFSIIRQLIEKAEAVINCGDAGQEGELIQRWVQQKAGCKCPVKRLWISSLTTEAIQEGFAHLKDQDAYQTLYEAGLMRAIGDWLLGMNATRAYTLRYSKTPQSQPSNNKKGLTRQVLSIGRVQTPTLALIVQRQHEIEQFVPRTYWELKTEYRGTLFSAIVRKSDEDLADELEKLKQKAEKSKKPVPTWEELQAKNAGIESIQNAEMGQELISRIEKQPFEIVSVEKKKGTESAPRLFDLTSLQVECNKKYGFSADETLKLIQSLYEKKVTTYPRVDTTYLSEDIYPKCGSTLKGIESYFEAQISPLHGKPLPKSKKVFDNSKVTDHHAIIPTGQRPDNITETERKVFNLVALRFIAAFYPDCEVSNTTVMGQVTPADSEGAILFRATGRQVSKPGWRTVFAQPENAEEENSEGNAVTSLPAFTKGERGEHTPKLMEKQTTPPRYYTEATLLRAMETAGKTVEDEELRDALKENGIGRPSTRAAIIEKLFQRQYIIKEKKNLKATPMGMELIQILHTPLLKSAELTGQWERKLRQIERGELTAQQFLDELKALTTEVVRDVKTSKIGMLCPVCRKGTIIRGKTAYGCSRWREGCNYREPLT